MIQKIQPFIAVVGAALLLGERPRPRFAWFFSRRSPASGSSTRRTRSRRPRRGRPDREATGAALLWAIGTVLGRYLTREIEFQHVLALRFFFGLIGSAIALPVMGAGPARTATTAS